MGTACSRARLYINEFFLVPPNLWLGLCLDSGANKSGIVTALSDIASGFEKVLLKQALANAAAEAQDLDPDQMDMDDAEGLDRGESAKKRKLSAARHIAAIKANPPAIMSDEGSLPAMGLQMSQNSNRAVGLYDEGRFLLRALTVGEGSGFNPSTMSKLFNGSHWKRQVVKDTNRFTMHHTCLCLSMSCHIEEWHDFLAKDEALGMASRFLMFHSGPRLDKAADVLDETVYGQRSQASNVRQLLPQSLLQKFIDLLDRVDGNHHSGCSDYNKGREMIPYFFAPDALDYFCQHYDAQVLEQERAYLQDPKQFSHAGKLKSLPWRLSILLHCWDQGLEQGTHFRRALPKHAVETSKAIFEYLSTQSRILAPSSNLLEILSASSLLQTASQRYPNLILLLREGNLPKAAGPLATQQQASLEEPFEQWWGTLAPDMKAYAFLGAHWILTSTTLVFIDVNSPIKALRSKDKKQLPKEAAKQHANNVFKLLEYTQLACVKRGRKGGVTLMKRACPQDVALTVAFTNLLHMFKHKLATNAARYNETCLQLTESLRKVHSINSGESAPILDPPQKDKMEAMLLFLTQYVDESRIWDSLAEYIVRTQGQSGDQSDASQKDSILGGAVQERLSNLLFYPGNAELLPIFVLASHCADRKCRGQIAAFLLRKQYPTVDFVSQDCDFIFHKLEIAAPHLLQSDLLELLDVRLPRLALLPLFDTCTFCHCVLNISYTRRIPCCLQLHDLRMAEVEVRRCPSCHCTFAGPWAVASKNTSKRKTLLTTDFQFLFMNVTEPCIAFAVSFLKQMSDLILQCGATFQGLARCMRQLRDFNCSQDVLERELSSCWVTYTAIHLLGLESLALLWPMNRRELEAWCARNIDVVSVAFQKRWLLQHSCSKCHHKRLGIDGNAKIRSRLCHNIDDGVWNCKILKSHCVTGCQNRPLPGHKFCSQHVDDADGLWGSDLILRLWVTYQEGIHQAARVLASTCKRAHRALNFALRVCMDEYPVCLLSVHRAVRSRRFVFQTVTGRRLSLFNHDVPARFRVQHALKFSEPQVRECGVMPRVGELTSFSEVEQNSSCRKQWLTTAKSRRTGGILAAVRECQIIAAAKLIFTQESPTGVYFFLAELAHFQARQQGLRVSQMNAQERASFVQNHLPHVFYDCACTLHRFIHADHRKNRCKMSKILACVRLSIDRFHFNKGHRGCKKDGRHPLPEVWPGRTPFNDSACEQSFAFVRKIAVAARRMGPMKGFLFTLLVLHHRNVWLEGRQETAERAKRKRSLEFKAQRHQHDSLEALPLRLRHSG